MKRYIKIMGSIVFSTDNLTREDLVRLKNHSYDVIIDTQTSKTFDADTNEWKDIQEV